MKPATLTLFDAPKRLTKRLTKHGEEIHKESAALSRGSAQRVEAANARELAHLLENLAPTQALAYGITERLSARIGPRDHLRPGEISRTRDNFSWPQGPGVLFLDLDGKHDADDVPRLREILEDAMPELSAAPQVWTRSSSAGIHDTETGEAHKGGLHAYIIVSDAQAIPTIGGQLYNALWLAGHGRHDLSRGENPAALERGLIDSSVWQPERLDYAAPPVVAPPLERIGGSVVATVNADAAPLNPARIKPLSDAQQAAVSRAKAESKAQALEHVTRARAAILETLEPAKRDAQRRHWLALDRQTLTPAARIALEDGQTITAADVLADPARFHGRRCYDPADPDNGSANATQARIYADAKGCRVWSFAHGGRLFRIVEEPQAAPADVLALPPEPDARDVVGACYRHRAAAVMGGLEAAAEEVGASLEYAAQVWGDHLKEQAAPLHAATAPAETFETFEEVADTFARTGESLFTLAALGTGKSRELGGRAVRQAQAEGRPVLTVTVLRALTWQNAATFDAEHYSDAAEILDASHTVSTTVHSLGSPKLAGFLARLEERGGVVVVDEAAAVAELLFTSGGILEDAKRAEILHRFEELAAAGVQFLALDGDATPCASVLADLLGCRVVECSEQHHPDPLATVYPVQRLTDALTDKGINATPCHADIVQALRDGERVVLATDSREQAERLHAVYAPMATGGALCIHGGNADEPEQAAFRANPNEQADRWQLVTYSPALSVGVSVTSVEAHVFAFASAATLDAAGLWQLARRYRRPALGMVRLIVEPHLCRPLRQRLGLREIRRDILDHAQGLDMLHDAPELRGMVAATWQRNLYNANPLHALLGHLANIGIETVLAYSGDASGKDARKLARDTVRQARVERTATAAPLESLEADTFERQARAVPEDQDRIERHRIEQGLALEAADLDSNGNVPRPLVEAALYDGLLTRVRRLAWMQAAAQGADLEASADPVPGFAYLKHQNAQAGLMLEILEALRDDTGAITVTADKARTVADTFRRRCHVAYGDIPRPARKPTPKQAVRWLRDLLSAWGLACIRRERTRHGENRDERVYTYAPDGTIEPFAGRLVAHHLAKSGEQRNAPQPAWLSRSSWAIR